MQTESHLRQRAKRAGLRLVKVRQGSRWFEQYGPYELVDDRNCIVAWGMSLDDVERELDGRRARSLT